MSPTECRAKAAQIRALVRDQPDFAETAERIAQAWERAALDAESTVGSRPREHPAGEGIARDAGE